MELTAILELFSKYGVLILLLVTFLESLNCPGMPAGVILPAAGIYASSGRMSCIMAILMTIVGGMLGSLVLYVIGRAGGRPLIERLKKRSKHAKKASDRCEQMLQKGGFLTVFIGRVLPVVRTIMPLPAGAFRVSMLSFLSASALGIACYNIVCVSAGYFFGHTLM